MRASYIITGTASQRNIQVHTLTAGECARQVAEDVDEIVLWFEHDLYDQLMLCYLLSRLSIPHRSFKLSLVSMDQFPGVTLSMALDN